MDVLTAKLKFWAIQTGAMLLTCFFLPRLRVSGPLAAFFTVVVLAFINTYYWDAALFLQIPSALEKSTVVLLLINGALFWGVVKLLPGIEIEGVMPALVAPILFSLISSAIALWGTPTNIKAAVEGAQQLLKNVEGGLTPGKPAPLPNPLEKLKNERPAAPGRF